MLLLGNVSAATIYTTVLTGGNEVPPVSSTATGTSMVTLNGDMLTVSETFSGLVGGAASAAHIHCCALPGNNAGVAVPFVNFPSATSGNYTMSFDLTLASTYTSAFLAAHSGTAAGAEAALVNGLNNDMAYANIHNSVYPGGEIRGWLAASTTSVPEPGTAALFLLGLAPAAAIVRKKRS